ncbi:MAG: hypothetical protein SCH98_11045 [Deferrisomatales bacterium]|nr:hypothetical protein [Deferrisomatales bacterium]
MRREDTVARYDPLEAVIEISEATGVDVRTVAAILEGELDYLGCLGLLEEGEVDEAGRAELDALKRSSADLLEASDGEYHLDAAVSFIQRNRGIDKDTIERVVDANYRFMEERGFLDEDWGEG